MTDERETRPIAKLELRTDDEGRPVLEGYATVYDYPYEVGGFTEVIARGAGAKTAKDGDIRLLVNHDGVPLARSKGGQGTLKLESDDIGLRVSASLDPANPTAAAVISALQRGDMDQMSFAFRAIDQDWDGDVRTIREFKGFDVSVVTYPANPATVVKLRSDDDKPEQTDAKPSAGRSLELARRQAEALKSRRH